MVDKTTFKILIMILVFFSVLVGLLAYLSTHSLIIAETALAGFFFFTAGIYLLLHPFLSSSKEDC